MKKELWFAALTIGMMEFRKNGMMGWRPSGRYTPAAESAMYEN